MEETKVFVTADADFCLLLMGEEKKLMSFEEVEAILRPFAYFDDPGHGFSFRVSGNKFSDTLLVGECKGLHNFAEICEKYKHLLWPENVPA